MNPPPHIVRGYQPELDDNLIFDSWTKSIRRAAPASGWDLATFHDHRAVIGRLLQTCPVRVACHPEKPFVIYSYCCAGLTLRGQQVIHMVYTRTQEWRLRGLATELLSEVLPQFRRSPTFYTHNTRTARKIERPWNMLFHPYLTTQELV